MLKFCGMEFSTSVCKWVRTKINEVNHGQTNKRRGEGGIGRFAFVYSQILYKWFFDRLIAEKQENMSTETFVSF